MPIPLPSSAVKPRSQLTRANSVYSRSERQAQPASDEHSDNTTVSNRTQNQPGSQIPPLERTHSDAAKRRTFLPQRGLPKAVARSNGVDEPEPSQTKREATSLDKAASIIPSQQASLGDTKQPRLAPRSLYQTRASPQDTISSGVDGIAYSARSTSTNSKPPNSAGLSRTQSLRRPGAPPQPAPAGRIHTRTQSTSTPIESQKEVGEGNKPASRMGRPKSLVVAPVYARPSNNVPTEAATGVVRTSARLDAIKRSASTRSATGSSQGRARASTLNESEGHAQSKTGREALSQEPKKLARPAFSTLQQHFTPRKTGKAPTSTFIHASEPVNHALPPEIISLQNELLQLHLLHESSAASNKQWELSAQKVLRTKFDEVASLNQVMQEKERFGQEQKNILALREWNGSNSLSGLIEHIQALSGPLHELPSLLDPGGRYFLLMEAFSEWVSRVDEVWSGRDGSCGERNVMRSLAGLGDAWKGEHAAMTRKLTAFSHHLGSLPPTVSGSSIAHIVSRCQSLVDGLLGELQIMQATEADVVAREKHWVEERLRIIAQDVSGIQPDADEEAWRLY